MREERPRDRVLSNDELRRIWSAADDDAYGTIIKLLIFTGQRRGEIADLRWSEIDFTAGVANLSAERTKNKRPHVIPLAPAARALLEKYPRVGDAVFKFTAWSLQKRLIDERSDVSDWVIHDLRRTVATGMADMTGMADIGIQPHIIEAVLNHISGHKGGVAGIYNRANYAAEKAAALARWDKHIASLVG
jgi:integrase